jgi:opacity protein-like surface antigen
MKKIVLLAAVAFCFNLVQAQDEEDTPGFQRNKLFAGGTFGLAFGDYTVINLSPQVGYRFSKFLASGIGFNLQYASQKIEVNGSDYSKTTQGITGLNLFARFYPSPKFLIQLQPEANYIFGNIKYYQPTETKYKLDTEIVPSLLAGGGIVMPTEKGAFMTTVMYDLLQRANSPYGNSPIVSFGYNFNF